MSTDQNGNEFFGHLEQPATPTPSRMRRPGTGDFKSVPDPFGEDVPVESPRPAATKGPGLSPGVPKLDRPASREAPRSGVVLTPSGVRRMDEPPAARPPQKAQRPATPPPEPPAEDAAADEGSANADFHENSRARNDEDDVSWEEYAANSFPAMPAEDFGVKTKTTDSGRMVPVAVRADLTDEALKGKSIKDKGRKPHPLPAAAAPAAKPAPKSFWGRISGRFLRPKDEPIEAVADDAEGGTSGFARSGSQVGKGGRKKGPLHFAKSVIVEIAKIAMLVLLLRAYVVQVSEVTGTSMEGTLKDGERLIVERVTPLVANLADDHWVRKALPDFLEPEYSRGDIIVLRSPEDPGVELVKRLIGLPGDTLRFEDGRIFVKPAGAEGFTELKEDYLTQESLRRDDGTMRSYRPGDLGGEVTEGEEFTVPPERIFVLGDNRGQSNDSLRWLEIDVHRSEPPGINKLWAHKRSIEGVVTFRIWPAGRVWPPVK